MDKLNALFLFALLFCVTACTKIQYKVGPNTKSAVKNSETQNHQTGTILHLENMQARSFVLSCGSGFAISYTALSAERNEWTLKVDFGIDCHINEVLTATSDGFFIFTCDESKSLKNIKREGDREDFFSNSNARGTAVF